MNADRFFRTHPFSHSLWQATANDVPTGHPLEENARYDVLVVGAGIAGAVAALRLQAGGANVAIIDADEPGSGATGRSGGFIVPSFSAVSPRQLYSKRGAGAEKLLREIAGSADLLFQLVKEYNIDCGGGQEGWFQPVHSEAGLEGSRLDLDMWRAVGADMEILDATETIRRTGLKGYQGSILAPSGGAVHPVKLIYGLLHTATERGAKLHTRCRAKGIERRAGRWWADTEQGSISGERLLVCTNARSADLGLERCIVPLRVCQVATEPLEPSAREGLIGQGQSVADTRRNLFTYRFDEQWRLITGAMPVLPIQNTEALGKSLASRLARFLNLAQAPKIEYLWFGQASVTHDRLPAIYDIGPDGWALTACNGRGLAASAMLASRVAEMLLKDDTSYLPLTPARPESIHVRPLQVLGARLYSLYGRVCDAVST